MSSTLPFNYGAKFYKLYYGLCYSSFCFCLGGRFVIQGPRITLEKDNPYFSLSIPFYHIQIKKCENNKFCKMFSIIHAINIMSPIVITFTCKSYFYCQRQSHKALQHLRRNDIEVKSNVQLYFKMIASPLQGLGCNPTHGAFFYS